MKLFFNILLILVIFFKTGNLLSDNNLFSVNNILLEKKNNTSNNLIANQAIKKGFDQLIKKILIKEDISKVSDLEFSTIKDLVLYYNRSKNNENEINEVKFSVTFDKDKIHDLFYKRGILYSDITDKELFVLPILIDQENIFIFSNNFYYENWNKVSNDQLIEFILPLENIEIIQNINRARDNLLSLDFDDLFIEYSNKNTAIVLIENSKSFEQKIYLKTKLHNKIISKNLKIDKKNLNQIKLNEKIIFEIKDELINLVKSQNLIDIRTPAFLNVKFSLNKKNNLVLLNSKVKNIDQVENIFIQEFNKDYVKIKIKYFGKLEKIINDFKKANIDLQLVRDEWIIKAL